MYGIQKKMHFLAEFFFTYGQLSHKSIVSSLKRLKESIMVVFWLKFKKSYKNLYKLNKIKKCHYKIFLKLNRLKLFTVCLCDN